MKMDMLRRLPIELQVVFGCSSSLKLCRAESWSHCWPQVVVKTNNYQLFREDREREKDLFDPWTLNSLASLTKAEWRIQAVNVDNVYIYIFSYYMLLHIYL